MTAQGAKCATAAAEAAVPGALPDEPAAPLAGDRASRSALCKTLNGLHEIADGADRAEILRCSLSAR